MPGKFRKAPVRSVPVRDKKSTSKTRPNAKPIGRKPPVPVRIPNKISRRSVNISRTQNRIVKRQAVHKKVSKIQPRPRPVVRPNTRPVKVMSKKPAPPPTSLKRTTKRTTPRTTSTRPPKTMRRGVVSAGTTAVAAGTLLTLKPSSAHPEISMDVTSLQSTLTELQSRSNFREISSDITNLDSTINNVLNLLESARERGYVYQADIEDIAYSAVDRWQSVRDQVEKTLPEQIEYAQRKLDDLNPNIKRLNATLQNPSFATSHLRTVQDQANQVLWDLQKAESNLEDSYDDIESEVRGLNTRLTTIHWALDQLDEARFGLDEGEDLVMAVPNRWDKEGKDDPEGVLFLSDHRLAFERKEKIATKKVLSLTTSSEMVQEVVFSLPLETIEEIKAQSKGLFGHQDFLEVKSSDGKLGTLSLHINGQDSKEWGMLIERAKSGQIQEDRTSGSGLSFKDLTGPLTNGDLLSIQNEVNELQDEMMLKDVQDDLAELETEVSSLARDLVDLRARGYAVEKSLEADIEVLVSQWGQVKSRAETTIKNQTKMLGEQMDDIRVELAKLIGMSGNLKVARPHFVRLKSSIASAEAQAEAAEDTVLDLYDEFADEVESLSTHFDWVDWMLDALSTASFQLLATESGVAATEAEWERPGLEPENGILYLTDQRLLWEDRVGDFELKIGVPVQQITDAKETSDDSSEFDRIVVTFDQAEAPVPIAQFQLALPVAEEWLQMIGRARSGGYIDDRAIELDESDLERIRNAPEQCENCGAAFTSPILRGQNEMICEYCSVVTRI